MKHLLAAVKELNKVLELDPPIPVIKAVPKLESELREVAEEILDTDEITEETFALLETLGCTFAWRKPEEDEDLEEEDIVDDDEDLDELEDVELEDSDEEDEDEDEEEEEIPIPKKQSIKKKKPIPEPEYEEEDEDEEEDEEEDEFIEEEEELYQKERPKDLPRIPKKGRKKKIPSFSAYGTALDILCKSPHLNLPELVLAVSKTGINVVHKTPAINTARSSFNRIFQLLKDNGFIKHR